MTPKPSLLIIVTVLLMSAGFAGCAEIDILGDRIHGERTSYIIGGQPESGYAAVGALIADGELLCTGTLVSPTVVVTAAHCFEGYRPTDLQVFFGRDIDNMSAGETVSTDGAYPHPDYDGWEVVNDIAVVLLAREATVTPIPIQTSSIDGWVGRDAIFIGFGTTDAMADDSGVKYSVSIPITEVDDTTFTYADRDKNTCFGDSGGPALYGSGDNLHLIGVTSWGDEQCAEFGVNTRVDAFTSFVQPFIDGTADTSSGGTAGTGGSGSTGGGDFCEDYGWYGDGYCDMDCPQPDPDCGGSGGSGSGDFCEDYGWYGDGYCDEDCPQPDPDCGSSGGSGGGSGTTQDQCELNGWYGDGTCDSNCPLPDPDCDGSTGSDSDSGSDSGSDSDSGSGGTGDDIDWCEDEGFYGDGVCDDRCPQRDPDCFERPNLDDAGEDVSSSAAGDGGGCTVAGGSSSTLFGLLLGLAPIAWSSRLRRQRRRR